MELLNLKSEPIRCKCSKKLQKEERLICTFLKKGYWKEKSWLVLKLLPNIGILFKCSFAACEIRQPQRLLEASEFRQYQERPVRFRFSSHMYRSSCVFGERQLGVCREEVGIKGTPLELKGRHYLHQPWTLLPTQPLSVKHRDILRFDQTISCSFCLFPNAV